MNNLKILPMTFKFYLDFYSIHSLLFKEGSKTQQNQDSQSFLVSRDRKDLKHHRERQVMIKTRVGMPWCTGRF